MAQRGRGGRGARPAARAGRGARSKRGGHERGGASAHAGRKRRPRSIARRGRGGEPVAGETSDSLLTLVQIGEMTGISYPTLLRYVRLYLDRLPHSGSGRKRRFRPAAVAQFQKLRSESRRGRRAAARPPSAPPALVRQLSKLERGQRSLARQIRDLRRALARPVRVRVER